MKYPRYRSIEWERWDYLLGTMPDTDLAARIGCSYTAVFRKRTSLGIPAVHSRGAPGRTKRGRPGIDWTHIDKLLGTVSDLKIAKFLGCNQYTVTHRRKNFGIPPCGAYDIDWDHWDGFLGTMPDRKLAAHIGCHETTVKSRRDRLRIPAFDQRYSRQ